MLYLWQQQCVLEISYVSRRYQLLLPAEQSMIFDRVPRNTNNMMTRHIFTSHVPQGGQTSSWENLVILEKPPHCSTPRRRHEGGAANFYHYAPSKGKSLSLWPPPSCWVNHEWMNCLWSQDWSSLVGQVDKCWWPLPALLSISLSNQFVSWR